MYDERRWIKVLAHEFRDWRFHSLGLGSLVIWPSTTGPLDLENVLVTTFRGKTEGLKASTSLSSLCVIRNQCG